MQWPDLTSCLSCEFQDREKSAAHSSLLSKDQSVFEIGNHLSVRPTTSQPCALYSCILAFVDRINKLYIPVMSPPPEHCVMLLNYVKKFLLAVFSYDLKMYGKETAI